MKPHEFLEKKLHHIQCQLNEAKDELSKLDPLEERYDWKLLLSSEKYRLEVAMKEGTTNKEVADLLNLNERTVYRLRKRYDL